MEERRFKGLRFKVSKQGFKTNKELQIGYMKENELISSARPPSLHWKDGILPTSPPFALATTSDVHVGQAVLAQL